MLPPGHRLDPDDQAGAAQPGPAVAISPTGPCAKTATVPPIGMLPFSAPMNPVESMSAQYTAASSETESGIFAMFASASLTWKYSAKTPSLMLANFQPPSGAPDCEAYPSWAAVDPQSGVIAPTTTRSPGLNTRTSLPTSCTTPTASWPSVRFSPRPDRAVDGLRIRGADERPGRAHDGIVRTLARHRLVHEPDLADFLHDKGFHRGSFPSGPARFPRPRHSQESRSRDRGPPPAAGSTTAQARLPHPRSAHPTSLTVTVLPPTVTN